MDEPPDMEGEVQVYNWRLASSIPSIGNMIGLDEH